MRKTNLIVPRDENLVIKQREMHKDEGRSVTMSSEGICVQSKQTNNHYLIAVTSEKISVVGFKWAFRCQVKKDECFCEELLQFCFKSNSLNK